ncbi:MAG: Pvc16 family protein [bacterium]
MIHEAIKFLTSKLTEAGVPKPRLIVVQVEPEGMPLVALQPGDPPPIHLRLVVLATADVPLRGLWPTLQAFHRQPVFARQQEPDLPAPLERMTVAPLRLPVETLTALWTALGRRMVASLAYEVRLMAHPGEPVVPVV